MAIGVLMVMFTSALALFTRSLVGVRSSTDQLIATYLAQDAVEYILAKVEANRRLDDSARWAEGLTCLGTCSVDTTVPISAFSLSSCSVDCPLYYRASDNTYTPVEGTNVQTQFRRTVQVISTDTNPGLQPSPDEVMVKVVVSWESGAASGEVPVTFTVYGKP